MTHDPTKGCYTLDTLRALNPLYDHEHSLTQKLRDLFEEDA